MPDAADKDDSRTRRRLVQRLDDWRRAGVTHLPRGIPHAPDVPTEGRSAAGDDESPATGADSVAAAPVAAGPRPLSEPLARVERSLFEAPIDRGPALPRAERVARLEIIEQEVAGCIRCDELVANRTQTVFGVGNPAARLCFVGEAPGAEEDRLGEPFVDRAGQLLTKIIEACTLSRDEVYILNVLKCRPPGNRNPQPEEAANCRGYLDRQLETIRPEYLCCLGSIAAKTLLATDASIGRLRGRFHDYQGVPVMCTYHPAYLLRNPAAKKDVWEDMQMLMRRMGIDL